MTGTVAALIFLMGFVAATLMRDRRYERLYIAQRERGDYWFSRYMDASRVMEKHDLYLSNDDPPDFYS